MVFLHPKDILIGCLAQFTIMPLLALLLGKVFGLETALLTGLTEMTTESIETEIPKF